MQSLSRKRDAPAHVRRHVCAGHGTPPVRCAPSPHGRGGGARVRSGKGDGASPAPACATTLFVVFGMGSAQERSDGGRLPPLIRRAAPCVPSSRRAATLRGRGSRRPMATSHAYPGVPASRVRRRGMEVCAGRQRPHDSAPTATRSAAPLQDAGRECGDRCDSARERSDGGRLPPLIRRAALDVSQAFGLARSARAAARQPCGAVVWCPPTPRTHKDAVPATRARRRGREVCAGQRRPHDSAPTATRAAATLWRWAVV